MKFTVFIPLTKGQVAIIDGDDYEKVKKHKWCADSHNNNLFYAKTTVKGSNLRLHRLIMGAPKGYVIDHINRNGLDNRKSNLRVCSQLENSRNRALDKKNKSGHRGVHFDTPRNKWFAQLRYNGKTWPLGRFNTKEEAIQARLAAELKHIK